jgi:hypothetical protein
MSYGREGYEVARLEQHPQELARNVFRITMLGVVAFVGFTFYVMM